jgi:hypothetical protein
MEQISRSTFLNRLLNSCALPRAIVFATLCSRPLHVLNAVAVAHGQLRPPKTKLEANYKYATSETAIIYPPPPKPVPAITTCNHSYPSIASQPLILQTHPQSVQACVVHGSAAPRQVDRSDGEQQK